MFWRFIDFLIDFLTDLKISIKKLFSYRAKVYDVRNVKYFWEDMHGNGTYGG